MRAVSVNGNPTRPRGRHRGATSSEATPMSKSGLSLCRWRPDGAAHEPDRGAEPMVSAARPARGRNPRDPRHRQTVAPAMVRQCASASSRHLAVAAAERAGLAPSRWRAPEAERRDARRAGVPGVRITNAPGAHGGHGSGRPFAWLTVDGPLGPPISPGAPRPTFWTPTGAPRPRIAHDQDRAHASTTGPPGGADRRRLRIST